MKCRHCGENISRLDKDICPFCGGLKPLEGASNETQDITKVLESVELEKKDIKPKKRLIAFFLEFFLGIFGVDAFYIGKWKRGLIFLAITIVVVSGGGLALFFTGLPNAWAFLIPLFIVMTGHIIFSLNYLFRHDIQDSKGVFLK